MLKKMALLAVTGVLIGVSVNSFASHMVSGYSTSNGTYVAPHMSMDPYESQSTGMSYHNNELVPRY